MARAQPAAAILQSGRVRVGLFPSFFYTRHPATDDLQGWGIEMACALAARLDVELELIERPSPPAVVAHMKAGACDVAFLGISTDRAAEVDFSPPFAQADFTYLVAPNSPVQRIEHADQPGVRIAVVRNHAMDTALLGKLKHAEKVYADLPDTAFELLQQGTVTVLAGIRPGLIAYARRLPGSAVLADRYGANVIGMAVARGETPWLAYVSAFVTDTKASGAAQQAAERAGTQGLEIVADQGGFQQ